MILLQIKHFDFEQREKIIPSAAYIFYVPVFYDFIGKLQRFPS